MTLVYRAMRSDVDNLPWVTHLSSAGLGVRADIDVPVDEEGCVDPADDQGMSVSHTSPTNLSSGRRPPEYGGVGNKPVWELETDDLPGQVAYSEQDEKKGFLIPAFRMTLQEFEEALEATRDLWRQI